MDLADMEANRASYNEQDAADCQCDRCHGRGVRRCSQCEDWLCEECLPWPQPVCEECMEADEADEAGE